MHRQLGTLGFALALAMTATCAAGDPPRPLRALLITGGCCHDYAAQKDIVAAGLKARLPITIEHIHSADRSGRPPFPHHGNPAYAKGFDVVIHDECAADVQDPAVIAALLKPHLEDGVPAVNLHCAMHSYRFGDFGKPVAAGAANAGWFTYLGLQSSGHGPQRPIAVTFTDARHPITRGLAGWTTVDEELYNNVALHGGHAVASGRQRLADGETEAVVAWTNEVGPKRTRVFSTSLGHNNATVADARYLDLVARGLLWATGRLADDGKGVAVHAGVGASGP
jgi:hypothetical protein